MRSQYIQSLAALFSLVSKASSFSVPKAQVFLNGATTAPGTHLRKGGDVPGDSPTRYVNDPTNDLFELDRVDMFPNPCVIEKYCGVRATGRFLEDFRGTTPHISFNVTIYYDDGRVGTLFMEDNFCNQVHILQDFGGGEGGDNDDESESNGSSISAASSQLPEGKLHHKSSDNPLIPDPPHYLPDPPLIPIGSRMKDWGPNSCPPKKGRAVIRHMWALMGGYFHEANHTLNARVTAEGGAGIGFRGPEGPTIFDLVLSFLLKYRDDY